MTVVLDLPEDLESELRRAAADEGVDLPTFLREAAQARLRPAPPPASLTETDLLTRINRGFPESFWGRYRELIAKRRAETMTPQEQQEAIQMSDVLEAWRVERLQYLIELADLRQTTVDALAQELGLHPTPVE